MTQERFGHGIGVVTINGKEKLAVFGGSEEFVFPKELVKHLDSVELYNAEAGKWEPTDIKLNEPKEYFGFVTVKLSEIISKP